MKLTTDRTLASLVTEHPAASRVFHRHGLDFCCGGQATLADACERSGDDVQALIAELEAEMTDSSRPERTWGEAPLEECIEHILDHFHAGHREEMPRLLEMARKVEEVHADKPDCPRGLADHLAVMVQSMEEHMQKEEMVLFPMIQAGRGRQAAMPIECMESEHRDHGQNLERLRELANGYEPPADACNTWRALFMGLAQLERDVMEHVHLENNVVFPRALRGGQPVA